MPGDPLSAYQSVEKNSMSGRELEAMVLTRAAFLMQNVRDHWDDAERDMQLSEALKYNQRVWTLFQVELTDDQNPLPMEIKQNLLSLAKFIDKRIFDVLSYPAAEKLDILININRNIAAGLQTTPATAP